MRMTASPTVPRHHHCIHRHFAAPLCATQSCDSICSEWNMLCDTGSVASNNGDVDNDASIGPILNTILGWNPCDTVDAYHQCVESPFEVTLKQR